MRKLNASFSARFRRFKPYQDHIFVFGLSIVGLSRYRPRNGFKASLFKCVFNWAELSDLATTSGNIPQYDPRARLVRGYYYTTQAVRGPITKINQSKCSIAGPIFSKYRTGHCPEWSRTCVFAFLSRVINLLLTKLARDRTGRISALGLFCTDLAALGPYCQDPGPIFSQNGPRA